MNQVSHFDFKSSSVRVVLDENKEPWFCLTDVYKSLDISRTSRLFRELDEKGVADYHTPTNGGIQKLKFINEPNLYRIIFRSNKPEAIHFQNWVFAEVLPSIRKTGSYSARQTAYNELNRLHMQAKVQKEKGSFHGRGLNQHKYAMRHITNRILTCETNIQLIFEGYTHE